jgi:predicted AAA+ superfamily ATPase
MISGMLSELSAIALDGAKAVGKTSTAEQHTRHTLRFDLDETIELMSNGIQLLRNTEKPVCLDEWQRYPKVWDYVRRLVDEDRAPNQFILTGSAVPQNAAIHSGAGRIVRLRMRPLSLQERELDKAAITVASLFHENPDTVSGSTSVTLEDYLHEVIVSGFPAIRELSTENARHQIDGYLANLVQREFPEQGLLVRKPGTLFRWLRAYAAATASTASYQTILDASTPGERPPAKATVQSYRDILDELWITDRVDAWLPTVNLFSPLGKSPKHYLVDPALSASLLSISENQLLRAVSAPLLGPQHGSVAGRLFESLIAQSLQTYAVINRAKLGHFRNAKGNREIDFILERDYHVLAIEVKMSVTVDDSDVRHLNWLAEHLNGYELIRIVITTGPHAYTRKDGVHVIPAALLGA